MDREYTLIDNEEAKQYEFHIDGFVPRIEYMKAGDKIYLTHTEVTRGLEGKGVGGKLVKMVLEDIEQKKLKLVPLCPFVAAYIKRHPEWKRIVTEGVKI